MKLSVIGCGYLGAVHATAMAHIGHDVVGIDIDPEKISQLNSGTTPFFEPGFQELLSETLATGRLRFSTDFADTTEATMHFITVGTPQSQDSEAADTSYVDAAFESVIPFLDSSDIVVGKSTVPVGTAQLMAEKLLTHGSTAVLAWNPEFLREGFAIQDTLEPDRLVFGVHPEDPQSQRAITALRDVYSAAISRGTPVIETNLETAELVKVSANAFLATKISFINAMSEVAEATGADVTALADALGYDSRIGRKFLNAGVGFGGGCLPKDIRAFSARARELGLGQTVQFLEEVDHINLRQRHRVVQKVKEILGADASGAKVSILGLAFKPHSDDVRDSPALDVAVALMEAGADVVAYDPEARETARKKVPGLNIAESLNQALLGADVVVILTEWPEFKNLQPEDVADLVAHKRIIDARNVLDLSHWRKAGFIAQGMGKPSSG